MEEKGMLMLARMVLPKEVLEHFIITDIEYVDTKAYDEPEMHIHLDEKMERFWRKIFIKLHKND